MSDENKSESSVSDSEISACSSAFDALKVLYSSKCIIPVENAPMYENISQFENALKAETSTKPIPVGEKALVQKREDDKAKAKLDREKEIEEINKQRFSRFEVTTVPRPRKKIKNVLTRIDNMDGPLATLKECVDSRLRIKVITRNATGIRGVLHATLVAFDKQWNLALTDVLEVWTRKGVKKRKIPPMGTPVPRGSAAQICSVPVVTETPLGKGLWECTRHLPQMLVRGEHVVLVNIVER